MSNKNRSRDATFNLKSCKNRSIETKQQQSTTKPSPKSTKNTRATNSKQKKTTGSASNSNKLIKSTQKLNQFVKAIANKLSSFQDDFSTPITFQSSTQASESLGSGLESGGNFIKICENQNQNGNKNRSSMELNLTTQILLEQLHNCRKQISKRNQGKQAVSGSKQEQKNKLSDENILNTYSQKYPQMFDKALSRPHCLRKINVKRKNINFNQKRMSNKSSDSQSESLIQQQIKIFKKQQNNNWTSINRQLEQYLTLKDKQEKQKQHKHIVQILKKQAMANYKWVQIQQKMKNPLKQKQLHKSQQPKIKVTKILQREQKNVQVIKIQIQSKELQTLASPSRCPLKNYNMQKYIWKDQSESSSFELMCEPDPESLSQFQNDNQDIQSAENSDLAYVSIDPKLINYDYDTSSVQDNIDLVFNWLIDQFVIELAEKLDFTMIFRAEKEEKQAKDGKDEYINLNYQQYMARLHRINQIASDCQKISTLDFTDTSIHHKALQQCLDTYPDLTVSQAKHKLCRLISHRRTTAEQIIRPSDKQELEWIRIGVISELEEMIWGEVIGGQVGVLGLGWGL